MDKAMATHSNILAWNIPGTAEPGGLPSVGLQGVRHDWSDLAAVAASDEARSLYFAYQKFILVYISLKMNIYKIS